MKIFLFAIALVVTMAGLAEAKKAERKPNNSPISKASDENSKDMDCSPVSDGIGSLSGQITILGTKYTPTSFSMQFDGSLIGPAAADTAAEAEEATAPGGRTKIAVKFNGKCSNRVCTLIDKGNDYTLRLSNDKVTLDGKAMNCDLSVSVYNFLTTGSTEGTR